MQTCTLGYLLRKARKTLKLLQRHVAAACGMTQRRLSDLERNVQQPFDHELPLLARKLKLDPDFLKELRLPAYRPTADLLDQFCGDRPEFRHPRDRDSSVRLAALRKEHYHEYYSVVPDLQARADRDQTRRFLCDVMSDSQFEMLAWMRILKEGMKAARLAPQRANFRALPVIDPATRRVVGDCPVPCLCGEVRGHQVLIFPQQSLLTPVGVRRPDALVGVRTRHGAAWGAAEVDGAFKNLPEQDNRSQDLGMPVVRFTQKEVIAQEFAEHFWDRVLAAVVRA